MSTTQLTQTHTSYPNHVKGARVRVVGGFQSGRVGAIIKVNRRTIRVALDSRPGDPADITETMIGSPKYFELI